jgi:hypothetical protein
VENPPLSVPSFEDVEVASLCSPVDHSSRPQRESVSGVVLAFNKSPVPLELDNLVRHSVAIERQPRDPGNQPVGEILSVSDKHGSVNIGRVGVVNAAQQLAVTPVDAARVAMQHLADLVSGLQLVDQVVSLGAHGQTVPLSSCPGRPFNVYDRPPRGLNGP